MALITLLKANQRSVCFDGLLVWLSKMKWKNENKGDLQMTWAQPKPKRTRLAKLNILIICGFSFDIGLESRQKPTSTAHHAHHTDGVDYVDFDIKTSQCRE